MGRAPDINPGYDAGTESMPPTAAQGCERWKPIPGWEMRYEVSTLGRVRRVTYCRGSFPGRVIVRSVGFRGRPKVNLYRDGASRSVYVHVIMALVFLGDPPPKTVAAFKDGDPTNLVPENLCYRTPKPIGASNGRPRTH